MHARWFFLIFLFTYLSLHRADCAMTLEQMEKVAKGFRNNCMSKTGADSAAVDGIKKGQFPDDHNVKCYAYCIMKVMRTMNDANIDKDMLIKQIEIFFPEDLQARLKATTEKCVPQATSSDKCEAAYQYVQCTQQADPDAFFFP
uniref:Odorant binding protein 7 n=1 Tax=Sclerodermus sp. MQW-2015 TaxID=1729718 RepID=A0A0N7FD63_9HYME|nr:odorant binding protein 7 [Sclerodermus sp. MQW-2015]